VEPEAGPELDTPAAAFTSPATDRLDGRWMPPTIGTADRLILDGAQKREDAGQDFTKRQRETIAKVNRERFRAWRRHVMASIPLSAIPIPRGTRSRLVADFGLTSMAGEWLPWNEWWAEVHGFLKKNRSAIVQTGAAVEDVRREQKANADYAELRVELLRAEWIPREDVRELMDRVADRFRTLTEGLASAFGPRAHQMMNDAIDDLEQMVARDFGNGRRKKLNHK